MNMLIPILVIVPLASAFLIMVLGRVIGDMPRYFASVVMLFLLLASFYTLMNTGPEISVYQVGGWGTLDKIPIGIVYGS